jgi:hypothetical protein
MKLISRKKPVKIGEPMHNGTIFLGWVKKITRVEWNLWDIVIAGASR